MSSNVEAFPLQWPAHWARTPASRRSRANFGRIRTSQSPSGEPYAWKTRDQLTVAQARERLEAELTRLGARGIVISSNVPLRRDGLPMSGRAEPADPGVAVYFTLKGQQRCLPCDRWDRAADNIAAIAKHVEAIRGMDRWGVGNVEAMFQGFKALPGGDGGAEGGATIRQAMTHDEAAEFLARVSGRQITLTSLVEAVRAAKLRTHPDRGGNADDFARVIEAERVLTEGGAA